MQSSRKHVRGRVGIIRTSSSEAAECNCRQQCTKEATRPLILRRDMLSLAGVMAIAGLQMTPSLDPTAANAAAATAASFCADFSVSPSGLAFCDSSPGSGIQASKGMLIKVWSIPPLPFQLLKILNCFLPWLWKSSKKNRLHLQISPLCFLPGILDSYSWSIVVPLWTCPPPSAIFFLDFSHHPSVNLLLLFAEKPRKHNLFTMLKGFITVVSANHRKAIVYLQRRNWQYINLSFMMEWKKAGSLHRKAWEWASVWQQLQSGKAPHLPHWCWRGIALSLSVFPLPTWQKHCKIVEDLFDREPYCKLVADLFDRDPYCKLVEDLFDRKPYCKLVKDLFVTASLLWICLTESLIASL